MKTSELREIATGKQPYATLESDLASEVIWLREFIASLAEKQSLTWIGHIYIEEHDE